MILGQDLVTNQYLGSCSPNSLDPKGNVVKGYNKLFNLRMFGCRDNAHVNKGKLDSRAKKCIFLGYQDGVIRFKLWELKESAHDQ